MPFPLSLISSCTPLSSAVSSINAFVACEADARGRKGLEDRSYAQVNLLRAQSALIVARYQARITRLEIERLIGNVRIE